MYSRTKLAITILALAAAGCASDATTSAVAGGTRAVDATPVRTLSGDPVTSRSGAPVTGRDWNCSGCYR